MKVVYTDQAIESLEESIYFYCAIQRIPIEKVESVIDELLDYADSLEMNPYRGQKEPHFIDSNQELRRIIHGNFKIIYCIDQETIYITDFFDSRQNPDDMKG